jgi:hypothetical protein
LAAAVGANRSGLAALGRRSDAEIPTRLQDEDHRSEAFVERLQVIGVVQVARVHQQAAQALLEKRRHLCLAYTGGYFDHTRACAADLASSMARAIKYTVQSHRQNKIDCCM